MKKLVVDVCVCTSCVMNGAMDIIESIESLKTLKVQLRLNTQVDIVTHNLLGGEKHKEKSPLVRVDGEMIENAVCENVMSRIIAHSGRE